MALIRLAILSTAITFLIGMAPLLACQWLRSGRSDHAPVVDC